MKTLYILTAFLYASSIFAQQGSDEILASNDLNNEKIQHSIQVSDFQKMNAEKLDGAYKLLNDTGKLIEVRSFKAGKMDGTWLEYSDSQNLLAIANYKNDLKHGKWVIWDDNGVKRFEMHYENGHRSGLWMSWNEDGKLLSTREY